MGALLRRLEAQVRNEPALRHDREVDTLSRIEQAIVSLVAIHIELRMKQSAESMGK